MERVHRPELKSWISSEPLNISAYFADLADLVEKHDLGHRRSRKNCNMGKRIRAVMSMDVSDEEFDAVADLCAMHNFDLKFELGPRVNSLPKTNLDAFVEGNELRFRPQAIPEEVLDEQRRADQDDAIVSLNTLEHQASFLSNCSSYVQSRRVSQLRRCNDAYFDHYASSMSMSLLCNKEALLVVRVYKGCEPSSSAINALRYQQEIYLLASNQLCELRDIIKCRNDAFVPTDVSQAPTKIRKVKNQKQLYPSGFFFIEDCFYNDTRQAKSIDYSKTIREWAASNEDRNIGPFETRDMQSVCVRDLENIRLGYPYLYMHQGDCEHLFTINQVRLVSSDDPQLRAEFPFERSASMVYDKMCMVCGTDPAKWIVTEHKNLPEDPFLFCDDCFKSFNYDAQGYKVDNFKAFAYVNANEI